MHVAQLALVDFRNYAEVELGLGPGVTVFLGRNGQGKTNLVEAIGYLATGASHRVATDAPLVRAGAPRAVVRAEVVNAGRAARIEMEITPGKANRARLNRAPVTRARDVLGLLRTVLFAPEDQALVKGDPDTRRRFLDDLLVARAPRFAGVRQDYDRVLRQRNTLLKTAGQATRSGSSLAALDAWDASLTRLGAELVAARLDLVAALEPLVRRAYGMLAPAGREARIAYRASFGSDDLRSPQATDTDGGDDAVPRDRTSGVDVGVRGMALAEALATELAERREEELRRGVSLVGPHRDDLLLQLGDHPAKGYASHGESWSFALALRLAAYDLLAMDGGEPVLILDDVFAELDTERRTRLAARVAEAEQVLVTAAVVEDVPAELSGVRYLVDDGKLSHSFSGWPAGSGGGSDAARV